MLPARDDDFKKVKRQLTPALHGMWAPEWGIGIINLSMGKVKSSRS
jgi:hypothetical protein